MGPPSARGAGDPKDMIATEGRGCSVTLGLHVDGLSVSAKSKGGDDPLPTLKATL